MPSRTTCSHTVIQRRASPPTTSLQRSSASPTCRTGSIGTAATASTFKHPMRLRPYGPHRQTCASAIRRDSLLLSLPHRPHTRHSVPLLPLLVVLRARHLLATTVARPAIPRPTAQTRHVHKAVQTTPSLLPPSLKGERHSLALLSGMRTMGSLSAPSWQLCLRAVLLSQLRPRNLLWRGISRLSVRTILNAPS